MWRESLTALSSRATYTLAKVTRRFVCNPGIYGIVQAQAGARCITPEFEGDYYDTVL